MALERINPAGGLGTQALVGVRDLRQYDHESRP
jgi:hypothetical protein